MPRGHTGARHREGVIVGHGISDDELRELRSVAADVAGRAAATVLDMRAAAISDVDTKSTDTDVVTAADTASERLIRDRLALVRPGEPVLGEEEGVDRARDGVGTWRDRDGVVWVVDPIDGTVNYLYGLPVYGVSVAATVRGHSVAGAIVEPATGRVWRAARGLGATVAGPDGVERTLRASRATRLDQALVGTGFAYAAARRARQARLAAALLTRGRDIRRSGSAVFDLGSVAAGWLDAYLEHGLNPWDWAAGSLLAEEAGAVVRLPGPAHGGPGRDDGLGDLTLAAAPGVAEALFDLVRDVVAAEPV